MVDIWAICHSNLAFSSYRSICLLALAVDSASTSVLPSFPPFWPIRHDGLEFRRFEKVCHGATEFAEIFPGSLEILYGFRVAVARFRRPGANPVIISSTLYVPVLQAKLSD